MDEEERRSDDDFLFSSLSFFVFSFFVFNLCLLWMLRGVVWRLQKKKQEAVGLME